jgi:hypothetical protein
VQARPRTFGSMSCCGSWPTPTSTTSPASRDLLLKAGAFEAYAGFRQGFSDDAGRFARTPPLYEIGYYVDGKRRDLLDDMRNAADWCEEQLSSIEQKVRHIPRAGDPA